MLAEYVLMAGSDGATLGDLEEFQTEFPEAIDLNHSIEEVVERSSHLLFLNWGADRQASVVHTSNISNNR